MAEDPFIPINDLRSGDALNSALRTLQAGPSQELDVETERYWSHWQDGLAFGWRELLQLGTELSRTSEALAAQLVQFKSGTVDQRAATSHICLQFEDRTVELCVRSSTQELVGHIDDAQLADHRVHVRGWAFDARRLAAPQLVLAVDGTRVLACGVPDGSRADVAAYLKQPAAQSCGFELDIPAANSEQLQLVFVFGGHAAQWAPCRTGPLF